MDPGGADTSGHAAAPAGTDDVQRPKSGQDQTFRVRLLGARQDVSVSGRADERIDRILSLQRGRVSRAQLLQGGITSSGVNRRLARRRLIAVHPGVYRVGGALDVPLADETAALLALRPGALLSHETAGHLWGLFREPRSGRSVDITVTGGPCGDKLRDVTVHRAARLDPKDIRQRHHLPVTAPAHTILDLSAATPESELENLVAVAIDAHLLKERDLRDVLDRHPGHHGAGHLKRVLRRPTELTRSPPERLFLELIRQAELPMPTVNHRRGPYEPDFIWPEHRLIVEIDGYATHGGRNAFESDRLRDQTHIAQGFRTMRITYRQLVDTPFAVIARLSAALALAA